MLKIIEDEKQIKKLQSRFLKSFKPFTDEKIAVRIGHMGASFDAKVLWSSRLGIWIYSTKIVGSRYWNAFGLDKPKAQSALPITCEINLPLSGIDRRIGGALAADKKGNIYLVHRGIIGGGKKGVGKSLFETRFRGVWAPVEDGDQETPAAVIGMLNSPRFIRQVLHFIHKIDRIKNQASSRSLQLKIFDEYGLKEELIGAGLSESQRNLEAECSLGLIIGNLYDGLTERRQRVANDALNDLFIADKGGAVKALFAIKTDASAETLHQGAMQLLMNSLSLPRQPRLILVIPEEPDRHWKEKLKKSNIELLIYRWNGDRAEFPALDQLLPF
ncbi:MAG: hypothetical protein JW943_08980 [Deltaproteobacteria bacterium]|nr:hypothetical protein [Deltaproteobacteria bacterium]